MFYIPNSSSPDITGCFLLQERADLLYLAPACCRIVKQVAKLARIRFNVDRPFRSSRIAFEDQDLVFWPTFLPYGVHLFRPRQLLEKTICQLHGLSRIKFVDLEAYGFGRGKCRWEIGRMASEALRSFMKSVWWEG